MYIGVGLPAPHPGWSAICRSRGPARLLGTLAAAPPSRDGSYHHGRSPPPSETKVVSGSSPGSAEVTRRTRVCRGAAAVARAQPAPGTPRTGLTENSTPATARPATARLATKRLAVASLAGAAFRQAGTPNLTPAYSSNTRVLYRGLGPSVATQRPPPLPRLVRPGAGSDPAGLRDSECARNVFSPVPLGD